MKEGVKSLKYRLLIYFSKLIAPFYQSQKSDIILFGSRNGDYYMDNSRALFEWYQKNDRLSKGIWMTKSKEVYKTLKSKRLPVARIDSLRGVILLNKAKYGLYTNRLLDFAISDEAVPPSLKVIFLSHGQSVKNTRLAVKEGIQFTYKRDTLTASKQILFALSTSPFMAEVQSISNGIPSDKYKITGFPRNDWMFTPPIHTKINWDKFTAGKPYNKVVLYAPTWRMKGPKTRMFPFDDLNPEELVKFIEDNNILLLLRPHTQDLVNNEDCKLIADKLTALSPHHVKLATIEHFLDANLLLPYVDVLISDYSSIYHDYLIFNRPICFIPYDFNNFDKVNGFKYPYLENLPGPVLSSQADFINEFSSIIRGEDNHITKREQLRKKIYVHLDGNACERVAEEIEKVFL